MPPRDTGGVRAVARHHARLAQDRARVAGRIRDMLDRHGIALEGPVCAAGNLAALEGMKLGSAAEEAVLRQCAGHARLLTGLMGDLEGYLEAEAGRNEDARLLASMTGMEPHAALLLALEIGDISRFPGPKSLVSWAGLCPPAGRAGDGARAGRAGRSGASGMANWALWEAANEAVLHDPRMGAAYRAALRRHADRHASGIVVVANKMATIAWHLLTVRAPYDSRDEGLYRRKLDRMDRARRQADGGNVPPV